MTGRFIIEGRPDLDGMHRAVIETDQPDFLSAMKNPGKTIFLRLGWNGKVCGCILQEVRRGKSGKIWVDRYKQRCLNARDGETVDVEITGFNPAYQAELFVPEDFNDSDLARLIGKPVTQGEKTALYTFSGQPRVIEIISVSADTISVISSETKIATRNKKTAGIPITYKDIGGLRKEIQKIREIIEYPLLFPEIFEYLGVSQPRGIILYGPPGTGKTLIIRALANEVGARYFSISGPELYSMWYGKSEENLRRLFQEAAAKTPSVIVIDELDALAPKRDQVHGELEHRIVSTLLTQMDGIRNMKGVVVIGTTNRINAIDPALRREGRFGYEIHIGVPDSKGRLQILEIHTRRMPLSTDIRLEAIAEKAVGFVGADLALLCREAAYTALRRSVPPEGFRKGEIVHSGISITQEDFETTMGGMTPSALREYVIELPEVTLDDIGGLDDVKRLLVENIACSISNKEVFAQIGLKPARGILLYGPPGTGKTTLVRAAAHQSGVNIIAISGPEFHSKWFGESEERVRFLFSKAREASPCLIFIDELDAAVPFRGYGNTTAGDSLVDQLLSEMDGLRNNDGIFVIGATNRPEMIDPALLRTGRFDYHIEVPLPDRGARADIFRIHFRGKKLDADIDTGELSRVTEGFSGSDIAEICRQSTWDAIREAGYDPAKMVIRKTSITSSLLAIQKSKENLTRDTGNPYIF
jgi:transitional endoplasmic reticulum ATPase